MPIGTELVLGRGGLAIGVDGPFTSPLPERMVELYSQERQAGDREALEELIRRWERQLFYYVRRLVVNESDAWDILQQTWTRVIKGIGDFGRRSRKS